MLTQINWRLPSWHAMSVAIFLSVFTATAVDARVEFRGGGSVYGFNSCEAYGWDRTTTLKARFRPGGLPGNPDNSFLTMFWDFYTMGLVSQGTSFPRKFRNVDGVSIGSTPTLHDGQGGSPIMKVRITRQVPRTIAADTDTVQLEGIIRHFDGLRGCTARFEFLMRKR